EDSDDEGGHAEAVGEPSPAPFEHAPGGELEDAGGDDADTGPDGDGPHRPEIERQHDPGEDQPRHAADEKEPPGQTAAAIGDENGGHGCLPSPGGRCGVYVSAAPPEVKDRALQRVE